MVLLLFKAIKNKSGYYLAGHPPRWHKYDSSHPVPEGVHHAVQSYYHEKAVEKHIEAHHASNLAAPEMIAQVTATGEALQRAASEAAKVSRFKSKMIAGQKPGPGEIAAFHALPVGKRSAIEAEIKAAGGSDLFAETKLDDKARMLQELNESVQKYVDHGKQDATVQPLAGATPAPSEAVSSGSKQERIMYDTLDLQDPKTYEDPEVSDAARVVGRDFWNETRGMSRGDFKAAVKSGKFPHLVQAELAERAAAKAEKEKSVAAGVSAIEGISIPGHSLTVEGENIIISGPFDADLHERIKRAGGVWDGTSGNNRKVWIMPATKGKTLKRIVSNTKAAATKKVEAAQAAQAKAVADAAAKKKAEADALAEARAKAPSIDPGKYGPFTVKTEGAGYRVLFPYDADRVSQIKSAGASDFRSYDKSWFFDKAKAESLLQILEKAKEIAASQPAASAPAAPQKQRMLYPLSSMPPIGKPMRLYGKVVVFTGKGESFRISEDHPSIHGSHLLGHEGDRGAYAYYRDATQDEEAGLVSAETAATKANEAAQNKAKTLSDVRSHIMQNGEMPAGANPVGDSHHDSFNVYGSGDRFVIGDGHIWYVKNNGMDGDNWSANNVSTGGAGAIGWRVPYSDELANKIKGA